MTSGKQSSVAIIVLTYNGMAYIDDCLSGLLKQDYNGEYFAIVVDNNSKDGTPEFVSRSYPNVTLLKNDTNLGFAGGNNVGIRYALKLGCDAVVLVNQDTIVSTHLLSRLVNGAFSDERIGASQALILLYPEKTLINSIGNSIHYLGFGYTNGYRMQVEEYLSNIKNNVVDIAYPSGAAVLLKRKALEDVGLFEERFFMYHEDLDLGWRLRLRKWRVVIVNDARLWHKYSFEKSIAKYYYMERNRLNVIFKNYSMRTIILILPMFIVTEFGLILASFGGGYFRELMRAIFAFLSPANIFALIKSRRNIEKTRLISDSEFAKHLSFEVVFQDVESPLLRYVANPIWRWYWKFIKFFI